MTETIAAPSLLEAALQFARRGWPVFPCNPKNKRPMLRKDRDADGNEIPNSGGVTKATTDEEQIREWWRKWPRAMIGVSVGRADMLVVDFDPRKIETVDPDTGEITIEEWTLDQLKAELEAMIGCALPVSLAVRTPSGGVHVYFRMPEGAPIGNKGSLPDHIDVRGLGGYTIVPPSFCDGDAKNARGDYHWLRGDAATPIADMPAALIEVLRAPTPRRQREATDQTPARAVAQERFTVDVDEAHRRYALRALDEEVLELEATPEGGGRWGGRNNGIYHAALKMGGLVGAGAISEAVVRAALESVIRAMPNNHDLPGALQTMENGLENGRAKPRDLSAVGARTARGRDSDRSASAPLPPLDAYADDFLQPAPGGGAGAEPFHNGTTAPGASAMGFGGRIAPVCDDALDRKCARMAMTDLGNAERFHARHGWRFRFCNELGWFMWDGRRWQLLSEEKDKVPGRVSLAVFDTVRSIYNEADIVQASGLREKLPNDASDEEKAATLDYIVRWKGSGDNKVSIYYSDELRAHARSSEGANRLGCIANLVKSFDTIAIKADAMDADRLAINVLNGTLRFCLNGNMPALRLDPHRPDDLISKVANVEYDPDATCEKYDGFLETVQPDPAMRRFLHQWGGLSLTGDITEQKLSFFHGKGRNGKSTLVDLWGDIAGDYGGSIAIESFLDQGRGRKGGEATPDLARLPGIRFLRTSEPEKGAKLAEALIKLITGGEPIDARHLNKGFFTFLPSFKVTVSGNHKPKITGHDDGIWRRVMLVPWDVQIPKEDVDKKLPAKLRKEASGVLNRMLEGLIDWRMEGLVEPEGVIAATAKYREQSDQLGRFLDECTRPKEGARAKSSLLFALFTAWAKATGASEWQQVGFTKAMEDRGFENMRSNGIQWLDIEMTKEPSDFAASDAGADEQPPPAPWPDDDIPL